MSITSSAIQVKGGSITPTVQDFKWIIVVSVGIPLGAICNFS